MTFRVFKSQGKKSSFQKDSCISSSILVYPGPFLYIHVHSDSEIGFITSNKVDSLRVSILLNSKNVHLIFIFYLGKTQWKE